MGATIRGGATRWSAVVRGRFSRRPLHIAAVLAECQGNTAQAARILGIARSTLYNKLHEYRLGTIARA